MSSSIPFQITVARQIGSGGSNLARRIACRMGYGYLDREILQKAAEELGISENEMARRDERIQNFWEKMLESFSNGCPEMMMNTPPPRIISDEEMFGAEQAALLQLTSNGSCVVLGRCGFHQLAGRASGLLNVFVHAPLSFRIERMKEFYGAESDGGAEEWIARADRDRERFVEKVTGRSWYDARNYHLSIDMSTTGFDAAEEMVIALAMRMAG